MPIDKIILDELNSPAFIVGLDVSIDFTLRSRKEAGFQVQYQPKYGDFFYPDNIYIGTEHETNTSQYFFNPYDLETYEMDSGLMLPDEIRGKIQKKIQLIKKKKCDERFHYLYEIYQILRDYDLFDFDYPQTIDWSNKNSDSFNRKFDTGKELKDYFYNIYPLITFHIHPGSVLVVPSKNDLRNLNIKQIQKYRNYKRKPNPVYVIAGSIPLVDFKEIHVRDEDGEITDFYPVIIVQQKYCKPLPLNTNFHNLSDGILGILKQDFSNRLLWPYNTFKQEDYAMAKKVYNIKYALYSQSKKELNFFRPQKFKTLYKDHIITEIIKKSLKLKKEMFFP